MKATKRVLENIVGDLLGIFQYAFQYFTTKALLWKGYSAGGKCALGIRSVDIKKAEPLSSASKISPKRL
ncbi:hypothetical protein D0817_15770 [Flavobacterium cupreum]|uniref:Uncharacterized protein n=2 Tax=Flavobacterium TaxID=237 RepID=A0A4Y7UEW4_9FLAO|nr:MULTISPECIES: hypothetical protein [Flavobacterium]RUT69305.1 hypothetical protein D0817_15770 [Flavobacterium cupreum]TCN59053.1 hypothetical protein EV142_103502 [Flavobacterium circumlabens]TEB44448.1 hypothetical protein D0809_11930 [Flavobacterium circumlabens]